MAKIILIKSYSFRDIWKQVTFKTYKKQSRLKKIILITPVNLFHINVNQFASAELYPT
jgi:hypothetical protein